MTVKKIASLLFVSSMLAIAAAAQGTIEMHTCDEIKVTPHISSGGLKTHETAVCTKPAKAFSPKGTLRNVHLVAKFPAVPTGAGVTFIVTKDDANGEHVHSVDYAVTPLHTTAYAQFTINAPGKYFARFVNYYDKTQVWASTAFTVGEDTVGPRAAGNTSAGQGKVSICREIDDDWKRVGESSQWAANTAWNVLFENPTPVGVDFIGIVIHKQGPDGKDVAFINEYQQQIGERNRKYATVDGMPRLAPGVYSIYIISWGKRETLVHNGNLTEYFAKTTLTVK